MGLKLAVIADKGAVQKFALDALNAIEGTNQITVFSCTNTRTRKRLLTHGAYYALNLLAVRSRLTRPVPVSNGNKRVVRTIDFASDYDGAWQILPRHVVEQLKAGGFDIVLKFGMALLRVPPPEVLRIPILSYHHGDPDLYRGRPAGFWEMAEGAPVMGQMVQMIGNRLDAGQVVAFAETKVLPWSYRATLAECYRHSPLIINEAIRNVLAGRTLPKPCKGRNCRLPSNWTVAKVSAMMAWRLAARLFYGAFVEKAWKVSIAMSPEGALTSILSGTEFPPPEDWQGVPPRKGYIFYADPFFVSEPRGILVEALNAKSSLGEIVLVDESGHRSVSNGQGHMSYPAVARVGGRELVVPETVRWSAPVVHALEDGRLKPGIELRVEGSPHVVDPTLLERDGRIYLFGNDQRLGSNALHLWTSDSLDGLFTPHPASPILISPRGGRMGGAIVEHEGRLVRLGQDFSRDYGDGLLAFEIETLTPDTYRERLIGRIGFTDRKGPHTLNVRDGELVFDWYVERFSPLAAFRRLAARRAALEKTGRSG